MLDCKNYNRWDKWLHVERMNREQHTIEEYLKHHEIGRLVADQVRLCLELKIAVSGTLPVKILNHFR